MASKEHADRRFTQDIHIRLTDAEAAVLQRKADEYGMTLSKAARMLMFRRQNTPSSMTDKERRASIDNNLSALKSTFKSVNTAVGKIVPGYEKSLTMRNRAGDPAVSTEQTIRTGEGIILNQLKLQDALNGVLREFGRSEVHVAAKPAAGTVLGDWMYGRGADLPAEPPKRRQINIRYE